MRYRERIISLSLVELPKVVSFRMKKTFNQSKKFRIDHHTLFTRKPVPVGQTDNPTLKDLLGQKPNPINQQQQQQQQQQQVNYFPRPQMPGMVMQQQQIPVG